MGTKEKNVKDRKIYEMKSFQMSNFNYFILFKLSFNEFVLKLSYLGHAAFVAHDASMKLDLSCECFSNN